jgi:hypothetical protein
MKEPPNGKGRAGNAASPESNLGLSLAFKVRKINQSDSPGWRAHAEWILGRFLCSGDLRDLMALELHLAGARRRLGERL